MKSRGRGEERNLDLLELCMCRGILQGEWESFERGATVYNN